MFGKSVTELNASATGDRILCDAISKIMRLKEFIIENLEDIFLR